MGLYQVFGGGEDNNLFMAGRFVAIQNVNRKYRGAVSESNGDSVVYEDRVEDIPYTLEGEYKNLFSMTPSGKSPPVLFQNQETDNENCLKQDVNKMAPYVGAVEEGVNLGVVQKRIKRYSSEDYEEVEDSKWPWWIWLIIGPLSVVVIGGIIFGVVTWLDSNRTKEATSLTKKYEELGELQGTGEEKGEEEPASDDEMEFRNYATISSLKQLPPKLEKQIEESMKASKVDSTTTSSASAQSSAAAESKEVRMVKTIEPISNPTVILSNVSIPSAQKSQQATPLTQSSLIEAKVEKVQSPPSNSPQNRPSNEQSNSIPNKVQQERVPTARSRIKKRSVDNTQSTRYYSSNPPRNSNVERKESRSERSYDSDNGRSRFNTEQRSSNPHSNSYSTSYDNPDQDYPQTQHPNPEQPLEQYQFPSLYNFNHEPHQKYTQRRTHHLRHHITL